MNTREFRLAFTQDLDVQIPSVRFYSPLSSENMIAPRLKTARMKKAKLTTEDRVLALLAIAASKGEALSVNDIAEKLKLEKSDVRAAVRNIHYVVDLVAGTVRPALKPGRHKNEVNRRTKTTRLKTMCTKHNEYLTVTYTYETGKPTQRRVCCAVCEKNSVTFVAGPDVARRVR